MLSVTTTRAARVLTVGELTGKIKLLLEDSFEHVAVVGEVSNAKVHSSGHWYFSLKDKDATISVACFRNANQHIKFQLEDGLQVVVKGKLTVYPPKGGYQLIATGIEPVGIGDWQLAFDQLKEKLGREGMLAPERKRPIPRLPGQIGIVTSITGAALQDILTALKRRNPNVRVLIAPARVQGEGSAEEVTRAIADLQNFEDIDVIIVARGGGSIEDLWSFNTEMVARAVLSSRIPIISGIGHETDLTICDLVADLRAPTPTAAAELVSKGRAELTEQWTHLNRRLTSTLEHRVRMARHRVEKLSPAHALARHAERLRKMRLLVSRSHERLNNAMSKKVVDSQHRFTRNHEKLLALSALNVLSRGYSILQKMDGRVITDGADVLPGDRITARLHRGRLRLRVEEFEADTL